MNLCSIKSFILILVVVQLASTQKLFKRQGPGPGPGPGTTTTFNFADSLLNPNSDPGIRTRLLT